MRSYDFSEVDFTQPEIMASLARAYAILLQADDRSERSGECNTDEVASKADETPNREETPTLVYEQLRLF